MTINKIPIKKLVQYRRMTERRKSGFVSNLQRPVTPKEGGGDYWIRSLSAISKAFRENDNTVIDDRLESIESDLGGTQIRQTQSMYKRNIDILNDFVGFDFSEWRPSANLEFLSQPRVQRLMSIKGLPIQVLPQHVFAFGPDNNRQVGAIWFVTWQDGYKVVDLGIYAEALFMYLSEYYSGDYQVNASACMIVDVSDKNVVSYEQISSGAIPSVFGSVIDEIRSKIK
ncbi:MAG: hypothetical protein Roseis2KO_32900 [Roseivirga sp.]